MTHPECHTPEHREAISHLPDLNNFIIYADNPLLEDVGRYPMVTERTFLDFVTSADEELGDRGLGGKPRSHHYLVWSYLLDDRDLSGRFATAYKQDGVTRYGFISEYLLEFMHVNDIRLGQGGQHVENLKSMVDYFRALKAQ